MKSRTILNAALACGVTLYSANALSDPSFVGVSAYQGWQETAIEQAQANTWWRTLIAKMSPTGEALPVDRPTLVYQFPWNNLLYNTAANSHKHISEIADSRAVAFILAERPLDPARTIDAR